MNKTSSIKLLNNTQSGSSIVLLSRKTLLDGESSGGQNPVDLLVLKYLARLMDAIQKHLNSYINYLKGDLSSLPLNLTPENVLFLSNTFFNLRHPSLLNTMYEKYRLFVTSIISSFENISLQVNTCKGIESQLNSALEKASILDDANKLKEYIQKLKNTFQVIPDQIVSVPLATIKEPYNTYIKMFGFPQGMLWEPDKLAFVSQYLNIQNV